jgi:hypothetical protein
MAPGGASVFKNSAISDIILLLDSIPVDLGRVAERHNLTSQPGSGRDTRADRYEFALKIAKHRLSPIVTEESCEDSYIAMLIQHHARSILLPAHLLVGARGTIGSISEIAAIFAVPDFVVSQRLEDADFKRRIYS